MNDLLRLEFHKLKRSKSFYIILIIMLAFVVISMITTKLLAGLADQINEIGAEFGETFSAAGESVLLGFLSAGNYSLLTAIFVAIVVCDDYESHIIKNIFARGYSRSDFYFAKFIYLIVATSVMFIISVSLSAVLSELLFGINGDIGKIVLLISLQYLAAMAGVSLYFLISVAIKKLGGAIALNIILPSIVSLLLALADTAVKTDKFSFADYWFTSFTSTLSDITVGTTKIIVCAVLSVVYLLVFMLLGYKFNERTEV